VRIDYRVFEEIGVASYRNYHILLEGEVGRHGASHVHIRLNDNRLASVAIEDGRILAGEIPRDIREPFTEWLNANRAMLMQDWRGMQKHERPRKYEFPVKVG
jgi:hypothetical protein